MKIKNVFYIFLGVILTFNMSSCERGELMPNSNELNELIEEFDLVESTAIAEPSMQFNTVEEARETLYELQAGMKAWSGSSLANYNPTTFHYAKNENNPVEIELCNVTERNGVLKFTVPTDGIASDFHITLRKNNNSINSYTTGLHLAWSYSHQDGNVTRNGDDYRISTTGFVTKGIEIGGAPFNYTTETNVTVIYNPSGVCLMASSN